LGKGEELSKIVTVVVVSFAGFFFSFNKKIGKIEIRGKNREKRCS